MILIGGGRSLARIVLLALVAAMLATVGTVGTTPPAVSAAVVPCARTWEGVAKEINPEDPATAPAYKWTVAPIAVPASSGVEDIDVTYDITHPHADNLLTRLTRLEGSTVTDSVALQPRLTADTSAQVRPLTFDDEATSDYAATSPTGRYRPKEALSAFDGVPAGATWRLDIANYEAITTARLNSWSVTITYTVCDADGDGAEEHTDNCKGLANPDQADLDGDGLGNACDADLDGDAAPDSGDNCPTVPNPDQADADRNGIGDACTGDDDGDGRADAADGCPLAPGATASGCPDVGRSVSMKLVKKRRKLAGSVRAGLAACRADAEVTLWKKRRGRDLRLVLTTTDDRGRWKVRAPRAGGTYYVSVSRTYLPRLAECAPDRSPTLPVRRR